MARVLCVNYVNCYFAFNKQSHYSGDQGQRVNKIDLY